MKRGWSQGPEFPGNGHTVTVLEAFAIALDPCCAPIRCPIKNSSWTPRRSRKVKHSLLKT
jgi:hypothetical protein